MNISGENESAYHGGPSAVISCRSVGFEYEASGWRMSDVNVKMAPGEILAITGPNGSGKTTLIKIMATILRFQSGEMKVFNLDSGRHSKKIRQKIAYVAQKSALADSFSAYENLLLAASFHGYSPKMATQRVNELMEIFALIDLKKRTVGELSGGQYRRVALARAMAGDPELLLLDEPTVGLDARSRSNFHRFLQVMSKEAGVSVVIASHDAVEVARLADISLTLESGNVVSVDAGLKRSQGANGLNENEVGQDVIVKFQREISSRELEDFRMLAPSVRPVGRFSLEFPVNNKEPLNKTLAILGVAAPVVSINTRVVDRPEISWDRGDSK